MPQQLILNVATGDMLSFDSFFCSDANHELITLLKEQPSRTEPSQMFIWGEAYVGKTHALQASCNFATEMGRKVSYLPLKTLLQYGPEITRGLDDKNLVVVDDVDSILGNTDWEEALFDLINRARSNQQCLLFSAKENPRHLSCKLPDLASRLIWGETYALHGLSSDDKEKALKQRAMQRGIELNDRVLAYLSRHYPRDMGSLLSMLEVLDQESIRRQSKITVPFIKQVL